MAEGLLTLMIDEVDADRVDEYIDYPDVEYLYFYRILEEGVQVVFDLDTENVKTTENSIAYMSDSEE